MIKPVNQIERKDMDYIGDGVYVLFDGSGIWLHANDHKNPTDRIYLEPSVLQSLINFHSRMVAQRKINNDKLQNNP